MHKYHQVIVNQTKKSLEGSEPIEGFPDHIQGIIFFENSIKYEYLREFKKPNWKIKLSENGGKPASSIANV